MHKTYITIEEDIYTGATAGVHMGNQIFRRNTSKKRREAAIFKALRSMGMHKAYITIEEDIYTGATAGVHMGNQISEEIPVKRGVRQQYLRH